MTEKPYAHLAPNYVAETIRAKFPALGIVPSASTAAQRLLPPPESKIGAISEQVQSARADDPSRQDEAAPQTV
jgi:hypothetical protein